jgi:hypothetical protein
LSRGVLVVLAAAILVGGCGASPENQAQRHAFVKYLARVEPIRLRVNRLLGKADPTLSAYRDRRLAARSAQHRIDALERRFAIYEKRIAAVPAPSAIRVAQRAYAHTYVLEDAYLSSLAAAMPARQFDALPRTQGRQRATIIGWRIRLELTAKRLGVHLPADVQAAGRGEIAPSPTGS